MIVLHVRKCLLWSIKSYIQYGSKCWVRFLYHVSLTFIIKQHVSTWPSAKIVALCQFIYLTLPHPQSHLSTHQSFFKGIWDEQRAFGMLVSECCTLLDFDISSQQCTTQHLWLATSPSLAPLSTSHHSAKAYACGSKRQKQLTAPMVPAAQY